MSSPLDELASPTTHTGKIWHDMSGDTSPHPVTAQVAGSATICACYKCARHHSRDQGPCSKLLRASTAALDHAGSCGRGSARSNMKTSLHISLCTAAQWHRPIHTGLCAGWYTCQVPWAQRLPCSCQSQRMHCASDEEFTEYLRQQQDAGYHGECRRHPGLPLCPCRQSGYWQLPVIAPILQLIFQVCLPPWGLPCTNAAVSAWWLHVG